MIKRLFCLTLEEKNLGIWMDSSLKFSVHVAHAAAKANQILGLIRRTFIHMDISLMKQLYHRLRGSASPVLTATGFVNWKGQFSTPHRIDTPQPITKKIVTGDYVGDPYGCAKLGAYP